MAKSPDCQDPKLAEFLKDSRQLPIFLGLVYHYVPISNRLSSSSKSQSMSLASWLKWNINVLNLT